MKITDKLINELQNRLKVSNRRGFHLNTIPRSSRYKFNLSKLSVIKQDLPDEFIQALLTEQPVKFKISRKDNGHVLNSLFEDEQPNLLKNTNSIKNLINQTYEIKSEKDINTVGFGYPLLACFDQSGNELTVGPTLIGFLRIKPTGMFLLGNKESETVRVGSLDNYVEVQEVLNNE